MLGIESWGSEIFGAVGQVRQELNCIEQGPRPSTEWDVSGDVISSRSGPHGLEVVLGSRGVKRDVRGDVIRRT